MHYFGSLGHYLGNETFRNPDDMHSGLTDFFSSKDTNFYKKDIEMLKNRWFIILNNDGDYILDWCVILFVKINVLKKSKNNWLLSGILNIYI